jgi:hypothetical protein
MITSNSVMTMTHGHIEAAGAAAGVVLALAPFFAAEDRSTAGGMVKPSATIVDATSGASAIGVPHRPQRLAFAGTPASQLLHFNIRSSLVWTATLPEAWNGHQFVHTTRYDFTITRWMTDQFAK